MGQFSTTFTSNFDVSNVLSGVNKIQQALSKLKLPSELQGNLKKSFEGVDTEVSKIQTFLKSGFKTQGDVTGLAKSFKQVETYINKIQTQTMKINPNLIPEGWSFSASTEIQKLVDDLTKAREKVANFWTDFSKTPIDNKFADQFKTLGDAVTDFQNKAKDLKGGTKTSQLFKGLSSALESGEVEKIKTALDSITAKYTGFVDKFKDKGGDWQVLTSLQSSFNAIKASLNEGNFKQLEGQVETLRSQLASLSEQDYSKLNTSLSQLATYVNSGAKGSIGLAAEMHKTNAEMDMFQSRLKYFFGLNNALNLVKRTLREAFNTVKELDAAMTETAVVTSYTVEDMWGRLPEYTKMANKLGATTLGAYQTATLYYQQGLNTAEVMAVSNETMKMARVGGLEYAEATDMMTAALRGFNMEINATSATKVNDVYSELAAITAANTEEIATAMTKTASIANSANMEFETTSAFLSQIIETTREAPETAGTALKTIIARFAEVKKLIGKGSLLGEDEEGETIDVNKIDVALKTVGISLNKFISGEEGLDDVFLRLAEKWDTLDLATQRYIATQAAGSRQQSRFIAMMSDYGRTMELVSAAENSEGSSQEQFEKTLTSMEAALNGLSNAWNEFTMGIANSSLIKGAVNFLTGILNVVNTITGAFGDVGGAIAKLGVIWGGLKLGGGLLEGLFSKKLTSNLTDSLTNLEAVGEESGEKFSIGFNKGNKAAPKKPASKILEDFGIIQKIEPIVPTVDFSQIEKLKEEMSLLHEGAFTASFIDQAEGGLGFEDMDDPIEQLGATMDMTSQQAYAFHAAIGQGASGVVAFASSMDGAVPTLATFAANQSISAAATGDAASAELWETATTEALTTGKVKLITGLKLLFTAKSKEAVASALVAMGMTSEAAAATAATFANLTLAGAFKVVGKAITGLIAKIWSFILSLGPVGWAILIIVAAIALLAVGGVLLAKAIETPTEKMNKFSEAAKEAAEAAEQAKTKFTELGDSLENLSSKYESLDELTKGTLEWKNAVAEINQEVTDLINKYPELVKYVTSEDGVLTLVTKSEEVLDVYDDYADKAAAASSVAVGTEQKLNELTYDQNKKDYRKKLSSLEAFGNVGSITNDTKADIAEGIADAINNGEITLGGTESERTDALTKWLKQNADYLNENQRGRMASGLADSRAVSLLNQFASTRSQSNAEQQVNEVTLVNNAIEMADVNEDIASMTSDYIANQNETANGAILNNARAGALAELYGQNLYGRSFSFRQSGITQEMATAIREAGIGVVNETISDGVTTRFVQLNEGVTGEQIAAIAGLSEVLESNESAILDVADKEKYANARGDLEYSGKGNKFYKLDENGNRIYDDKGKAETEKIDKETISEGLIGVITSEKIAEMAEEISANYESLSTTQQNAFQDYSSMNIEEYRDAFGKLKREDNPAIDMLDKLYQQAMIDSSADMGFNLDKYTNGINEKFRGADYSADQMSEIALNAENFGKLFGKEAGTSASNTLLESYDNAELEGIFDDITFNNAIDTLAQLQDKANRTSGLMSETLQQTADTARESIGEEGLLSALYNSADFADVQESLDELAESNGKITAENIKELAEETEILDKYLEVSGVSAAGLAAILTQVQLGDTRITEFTDSLIKAISAASELESVISSAFDFVDNNEWDRSEQDVDAYLQETAANMFEIWKQGGWADSQLQDQFGTMFGDETLNRYKDFLRNFTGTSEELGPAIEEAFGAEMEALRQLNETGSAKALWDYWDGIAEAENEGSGGIDDLIRENEQGFMELVDDSINSTSELKAKLMEMTGMSEEMADMLITSAVATSQSLRDSLAAGDIEEGIQSFADSVNNGAILLQSDLEIFAKTYELDVAQVKAKLIAAGVDLQGALSNLERGWSSKGADAAIAALNDKEKGVEGGIEGILSKSRSSRTLGMADIYTGLGANMRTKEGMEGYQIGDTIDINVDKAIDSLMELGATEKEAQAILDKYVEGTVQALEKVGKSYNKTTGELVDENFAKEAGETWEEFYARVDQATQDAMTQKSADIYTQSFIDALSTAGAEGTTVDIEGLVTYTADDSGIPSTGPDRTGVIHYSADEPGEAGGNANASGSAYAGGTWGTGTGAQTALTGELGQELVVDPHSGRWHTVGDNGAEFTKLPKDAIVFNHLQTKSLLQNRKIFGRGKALASGNAYSNPFYGAGYDFSTDPSKKTGSGSGASSGDNKEWTNELDQQYNTLERIEKITRDREKLEEELERIYEKGAALDNFKKQKDILDEIIDKQTKLIDMRKQELKELMKENEEWKDYAYFDPQLGQLLIDWEKIDALSGDKGKEFDEYFDDLEEYYDRLVDAEDGQTDAINDLYDLIDDQRDQYLSIEERVMDAILTEVQQVIDRLSGINEAINDSNVRLLESMQKSIDDERQLRENEDTEKEIADKQARLDLLSRDTSGTYATEIKELTKEIADMQEDYTDTLVDQAIQNLQDQYDLAADERERNIELLQNQKDFKEENGKYWDLALKMLSGNEADLEAYLMMYDEEYKKASPEDQLKMLEEMKNEYATGMAWYYEHGQNNVGKNEDGSINGYTGEGDADKEKAGKQTYKEEITGETKFEKENGKSVEYKKVNKTIITQYYNPDGTEGLVEEELKEEWVPTGNVYDVVVNKPSSGGSSSSSGGGYIVNGKRYTYLSQAMAASGNYNGEKNLTLSQANNIVAEKIDDKKIPEKVRDKKIKKATITRAHAKGGLADYTGPGWLDGTLSKPELVLNPNETQDFLEFVKIFRSLGNIELPSQNNGENHFDIHIEIDSMGSDYDVDQMVDRVVHKIGEKASYRNVNVITNFRR